MRYLRRLIADRSKRTALTGFVFVVLMALIGFGILLSNTYGAKQIADNASQLHWTNATKGAAGIARASLAQAVFFSSDLVGDPASKEAALAEARANLAVLEASIAAPSTTPSIDQALSDFTASAGEVVALAADGSVAAADELRKTEVEDFFVDLSDVLEAQQSRLTATIENANEVSGRLSRVTFVAIAFMIPAVTMVVFWFVLRRRMHVREAAMAAQVEAERELNRAKDDLIAGLSHELRTPLTTIYGFSEILFEDQSVKGEAHELIGLINASSADLSRMVNDILTAARLNAEALTTKLGPVDIADEVAACTEPYLRSGEALQIDVPHFHVYSDSLHLRQVIHNLVSNALRHGGDDIVISATQNKNKVKLVVADNGPGVPETMTGQLFQRFANRGRDALVAGSVGLGLAISQELADNIGGSLRYQRIDGWTTFTLALPRMLTKGEFTAQLPEPWVEVEASS